MSNVDQLHDAKVLQKEELSENEAKAIESLSPDEVQQITAIRTKMDNHDDDDCQVGVI